MKELDKTKFRFKIGDKVLYNNKKCKVLAYFFSDTFNNYKNAYGYTLEIESKSHNGAHYSYDEKGNPLSFSEEKCYFVNEKEPISIKKIKKIKIKIK